MKKTLCILAALAEPWSGAGTESNPWKIASAADLVALRDYVAASENATTGKYFLQTADISLSSVCGASIGDFKIGVWDGNSYDTHAFDGTYDGSGHAITGLYIGNGGDGAGLFAELEKHGTVKNLSVSGYVNGGAHVGGIVGHASPNTRIENCSFSGTVIGSSTHVGGIAGQNKGAINNCTVDGSITGGGIYVGGIAGYQYGGTINNCTVTGNITGSDNSTGGIVGCCYAGTIRNCTYENGTVTGPDWVGGIVGLGNAEQIENCASHGTVTGGSRVGGIAGETCGPIRGCRNYGTITGSTAAGGITGHSWAAQGYYFDGIVSGCKNYGNVTNTWDDVGGIVGYAEYPISECENYGDIQGNTGVGGIVGYTVSTVTACRNSGQVTGSNGSIVGVGTGGARLTLKSNGGTGDDVNSLTYEIPDCPFPHGLYGFFAWNTQADGSGTWCWPGDNPPGNGLTLYAIWMSRADVSYQDLDGGLHTVQAGLLNGVLRHLPDGWYTVRENTELADRLDCDGDVNLFLPEGVRLICEAGINVKTGRSLTIWGGGTLDATGAEDCAAIGGDKGQGCGTVTVNGCDIYAEGSDYGAGIGGGDEGAGGDVTVNGGHVAAIGSVRSKTGQASAGIGAGRPRNDGSQTLNGGSFAIYGGSVLAESGGSDAAAIGANFQYSNQGTVTVGDGLRVVADDPEAEPANRDDRAEACRAALVMINGCDQHKYDKRHCQYCNADMSLTEVFEGTGAANDHYLIRSAEDWNTLAALVNENRLTFVNHYLLTSDISVTTSIGVDSYPFEGDFDGFGHPLTVNLSGQDCVAPFAYVDNSSFRNLKVAGTVTGDRYASGLVGRLTRINNAIENVEVSAQVTALGPYCSGFVGYGDRCMVPLTGCVFSGGFSGVTQGGVFLGDGSSISIDLTDCLDLSDSEMPLGRGTITVTATNTYYTCAQKQSGSGTWAGKGQLAYALTGDEGVTLALASGTALEWDGNIYAPAGAALLLNLSAAPREGHTLTFAADTAELTATETGWTLTMPDAPVAIRAVYTPVSGAPDFTLPAALTTIEESAFEGMTAMTIVDASHCASIGKWAFKGCTGLTQIRLPADCAIDATAFDGCSAVYVFAPAGGTMEAYCQSSDNPCVFVEEAED